MSAAVCCVDILLVALHSHAPPLNRTNSNVRQGPLANPVNDVRDMAATLRQLGFEVSFGENCNRRQMEDLIREFGRKIHKGGVWMFYFAGHGVQVEGVNYLAPVGVRVEKEQDVKFEMLDIGKVTAEMEAALDHKPKVKMSPKIGLMKLTDAEVDALVAYLMTLK